MTKRKQALVNLIYSSPKYFGKHVIILDDKIFSAKSGSVASRMLEKLIESHPKETPLITYVPKADTLILFVP